MYKRQLQDTSIESVILQSTDFQALDDVVVNYSDKSILNIQVKHTDEDANCTYSFLASGKKPLLNALALEWKNNKDNYNFKGIKKDHSLSIFLENERSFTLLLFS